MAAQWLLRDEQETAHLQRPNEPVSQRTKHALARPDAQQLDVYTCARLGATFAFACGFALLSAEVFWTRILTFVFGHDTYAFATLLSVVVLGHALGGLAYPASVSLYAQASGSVSSAIGTIGLINGLGAATGALLTAFGLVTWLGIQGVASAMSLLLALVVAALLPRVAAAHGRRWFAYGPALLVLVCVALAPRELPRRMLLSVIGNHHQRFLHYEEARTATVSVIRNSINGERQLLVNAVNEVTTRLVHDQSFKLLGQLGPLLHHDPKRGVMICLGAGLAAGSALTHPLEQLDVVELLAAVRRGAALFPEENNHVLQDPRLKLHIDDGRQYLLTTRNRYDVAIVDSTHPKSVDSWVLYTRQFFELLRSRLNEGGIVVQWLPLHGLSDREFRSVVATFAAVFPQLLSLGHVDAAAAVFENSLGRFPASLRLRINQGLLWLQMGQPKRAAQRFSNMLLQNPGAAILNLNLGVALLAQGEAAAARERLIFAYRADPSSFGAVISLVDAELASNQFQTALTRLKTLPSEQQSDERVLSRLATACDLLGNIGQAHDYWAQAMQANPYREEYTIEWARRATPNQFQDAISGLLFMRGLHPKTPAVLVALGQSYARVLRWDDASDVYVDALELDAHDGEAALSLGESLAHLGRAQEAIDALCVATRLGADAARVQRALQKLSGSLQACAQRDSRAGDVRQASN